MLVLPMLQSFELFEGVFLTLRKSKTLTLRLKGRVGLTEKYIFNYAKQYITPHLITEKHENDNEKILKPHLHA